jgi:F-type H+-transporting ATPase subunit alpha
MKLRDNLRQASRLIDKTLEARHPRLAAVEIGRVRRVEKGIARITGLPHVKAMEVLKFDNGGTGLALNLDNDEVGAVILDGASGLTAGSEVRLSRRVISVPVGPALCGRVIDALGRVLDNEGPIHQAGYWPIERDAPSIIDRAPVAVPLQTGIKVIDALIPVGRGQRQLVLGDRQTGKTAIAVDTMLNQRGKGVFCIYCGIGQRGSAVARVIDFLRRQGAMSYCVVVNASGEDPAGLQYIAPYAATSIGEYFMEQGHDALVVYDDLTRHAHAYRELSLLLRRPPGREAYPGDIFYLHSRLLERATRLKARAGGGSLTALPIIETKAQNLSAYIPTNLISITDGQIYLSPDLFQKGLLPAVDVGKSVSRVGGKAQLPAYRDVVGQLRLAYTQFEELETFARFGTRLDEQTRRSIERGRRVREILKQNEGESLTAAQQIVVLLALNQGLFDDVPLDRVRPAEHALRKRIVESFGTLCQKIDAGEPLSGSGQKQIIDSARDLISQHRQATE